jgi:hypothetical protein
MLITHSGEICKKLYPNMTVTKATDRDGFYVGINNVGSFYLDAINRLSNVFNTFISKPTFNTGQVVNNYEVNKRTL